MASSLMYELSKNSLLISSFSASTHHDARSTDTKNTDAIAQVVRADSQSTVSKGSYGNASPKENDHKHGPKKMSIVSFNFNTLLDSQVIKYERPLRGYRAYSSLMDLKVNRISAKRMPRRESAPPMTQSDPARQSLELPEQAKIESVLKGRDGYVDTEYHTFFFEPLQLLRKDKDMVKNQEDVPEKGAQPTKVAGAPDKGTQPTTAAAAPGKRELATIHTVCAPKTGAIKLTGLAYELDYPLVGDDREKGPPPPRLVGYKKYRLVPQACPNDEEVLEKSKKEAGLSRGVEWVNPRRTVLDRPERNVKHASDHGAEKSRERIFG
ncbi:hypothetical protein BsWGS_03793 [Bradybaena similaris]